MPKAYELPEPGQPFDPEVFRLGSPCKRNHIHADGMTLRWLKRKICPICERIDAKQRMAERRANDPDYNRNAAAYVAAKRKALGRPSRSKYGLPYTPMGDEETRAMRQAIKNAGRLPSVARLVFDQQHHHWQMHRDDYIKYTRLRSKLYSRWRFMTDPSYRLYHRAKSKARKVAQRGGTPSHLTPSHLWRHWGAFDHRCAYCGTLGDLEVEHVVPISQGGQHHLGNIVPACHLCNSNKATADAHQWFKAKPFYSEARWQRIQSVLARSQPTHEQMALPLPSPSPSVA